MKIQPLGAHLVIPVRRVMPAAGRYAWPRRVRLASASLRDRLPLESLAGDLRARLRSRARLAFNAWGPAEVRLRRDARLAPEAYRIRIAPDGILIESATDPGAYYGVQTLRELLRVHGAELPCGTIEDSPDFERRGVYYDCSRGKVPKPETVKRLIAFLARFKINELQLYVENVFTFRKHPAIGRGFDPFSPEDLLEIQEEARRHHVRFVPSLTSFGHFERILALPAYRGLGELPGHRGLPGGTTLCPGDPGSIRLVADLYDEFLPLFDALDFNACCDETWELGRGRSKARAERVGLGRVYLEHLLRLHKLCVRHGKRMNIWADILLQHPETLEELPRDLVLLNWDYEPNGRRIPQTRRIADSGLAFMVCSGTHSWRSHGTRLRKSMDNVRIFAAEGRKRGAEGFLQTDWGDHGHRNPLGASLHGFAHGAAHAWNGRAVDDASFTRGFADAVFGASGAPVAEAIRTLGENEARAGLSLFGSFGVRFGGRGGIFRGIPRVSPVWAQPAAASVPWDRADEAGCRTVMKESDRALALLAGARSADPLLAAALVDLAAAAKMDRAAAARILAARSIAAGRRPDRAERARLTRNLREARDLLERSWLAGHRPSRLRDNLRLFAHLVDESLALR